MDFTDQDKEIINAFIQASFDTDRGRGIAQQESILNLAVKNDADFLQAFNLYLNNRKASNLDAINNMAELVQRNIDALTQDNLKLDDLSNRINGKGKP